MAITGDLQPPVVLLGGEAIALSLARGLATAGVRVCALGHAGLDPARYSRTCEFGHVSSGAGVKERYFAWLERTKPGRRVVLPCSDDALELVAERRDDLRALDCVTIEADDDVVLAMLDKERTYELARSAGIGTPLTRPVRSADDVRAAAEGIGYPFALKPQHSHLFARRFGMNTKLFLVEDQSGLTQILPRLASLELELMATEVVPGPPGEIVTYTAYLDEHGTPLVGFTRRKVRQYPPHFGRGCYYVMEHHARAAELGLHFFRSIGLRGLASVEFKPDPRDGQLKLIECNHRFDGAVGLARAAGLDLGRFTYDRLLGREPTAPPFKRDGVRLLSPVRDCRSALALRGAGELGLSEWARSLAHRQHFQVFDLTDPLPSVVSLARTARRALRAAAFPRRAATDARSSHTISVS
jgi:D-aspartate ligase